MWLTEIALSCLMKLVHSYCWGRNPLAVYYFAASWRLTRLSALVLRLGAVIWLLI